MRVFEKMIGVAVICCSLSIASCVSRPDPNLSIGASTVACTVDCVPVSKAFVKEHAELFDEVIRLRAALKLAHEKL